MSSVPRCSKCDLAGFKDFSVTLALRTRFLRMPCFLRYKALCQTS